MDTIGQNEELLTYMRQKELYILDSMFTRMEVYEEQYIPIVELYFKLIRGDVLLKVRCTGVLEYSFYYEASKPNYIERCKFFMKDDVFYISLDPYDEMEEINDKDQDFILCKGVEGFIG